MTNEGKDFKDIDEKLSLLKFKPDSISHIEIDEDKCRDCENHECTFVCPARVYQCENENSDKIKIEYENCLECGACKVACKKQAIKWVYPRAGCGIVYKFS